MILRGLSVLQLEPLAKFHQEEEFLAKMTETRYGRGSRGNWQSGLFRLTRCSRSKLRSPFTLNLHSTTDVRRQRLPGSLRLMVSFERAGDGKDASQFDYIIPNGKLPSLEVVDLGEELWQLNLYAH